jgi:hypothetical protein
MKNITPVVICRFAFYYIFSFYVQFWMVFIFLLFIAIHKLIKYSSLIGHLQVYKLVTLCRSPKSKFFYFYFHYVNTVLPCTCTFFFCVCDGRIISCFDVMCVTGSGPLWLTVHDGRQLSYVICCDLTSLRNSCITFWTFKFHLFHSRLTCSAKILFLYSVNLLFPVSGEKVYLLLTCKYCSHHLFHCPGFMLFLRAKDQISQQ